MRLLNSQERAVDNTSSEFFSTTGAEVDMWFLMDIARCAAMRAELDMPVRQTCRANMEVESKAGARQRVSSAGVRPQ